MSEPLPEALFARFTDQQLTGLGVAEPLVPVVCTLTTEDQLLGLVEYARQLTGEVLLALYDGKSYDDVLDQVTSPVAAPEPVDTDDFRAAAEQHATMVTTADEALRDSLDHRRCAGRPGSPRGVIRLEGTDAIRHRRELQRSRSLLFVAATRSRDALAIFWHGSPSRFLEPLLST